jgi:Na+/H+-dicarboxylate symporter
MFASTLIGFFFIPKEDVSLILSKTSSLLAAVVIGIIYGIFAGILVGSLQSLHEKDSLEKREQRLS